MSMTNSFRSVSPDAAPAYQRTTAFNPRQNPTSAIDALRTTSCRPHRPSMKSTIAPYPARTSESGSEVMGVIIPEVVVSPAPSCQPRPESRQTEGEHLLDLLAGQRQIGRPGRSGMVAGSALNKPAFQFRKPG